MKKDRILELDILRAIAFIFVVVQHTIGGYSNSKVASYNDMLVLKLLFQIAKIGVPIFITITGMVLFYSYYDKFSIANYYKKRILYIFIPYVIWSALCLVLLNHMDRFNNFFMQIISGNCCYHLWYMGMILRIFLFFPLILLFTKQFMKTSKFTKTCFFMLYTVFYWYVLKHNNITYKIGAWIFNNPSKLQQRFINITPITWSMYFVLGAYIIFNYKKFKELILKHKKIVCILYFITLMYSYYNAIKDKIGNPIPFIKFNHAVHIFYCIISILFFYLLSLYIVKYKNKLCSLLKFIGKYSFPAYLGHIIVAQNVVGFESRFIHTDKCLLFAIVFCLLTVIISTFICYLINFLPFSKYILGVKSKPKVPVVFNNMLYKNNFYDNRTLKK